MAQSGLNANVAASFQVRDDDVSLGEIEDLEM
jgi:hypothetical protein